MFTLTVTKLITTNVMAYMRVRVKLYYLFTEEPEVKKREEEGSESKFQRRMNLLLTMCTFMCLLCHCMWQVREVTRMEGQTATWVTMDLKGWVVIERATGTVVASLFLSFSFYVFHCIRVRCFFLVLCLFSHASSYFLLSHYSTFFL